MSANNDGRSGRILVISMLIGAAILGLFALRYRHWQTVHPTTQSATQDDMAQ